ncbi:hypothetical protein ACWEKT_38845 [Nocardia takedensis]|uniref:hypothetical protein n=1 Tax=Nocardia takedensis TaxID=259390 RepID=UPI000687F691|nr:hypothetical protein [Nocardia takedensis]
MVPVVVLAVAGWRRRWVTEDAFINFRVVAITRKARNPFAFNANERVEAGTSPLWTATLVVLDATLGRRIPLERLALGAGMGLSVVGLAAATAASARLVGSSGAGRPWPAGALILSALPPLWDFTTSGLETGVTFGWLGCCQWLLARRSADHSHTGSSPVYGADIPLAVLLGLGPLIRPDLTLFSAAFLISRTAVGSSGRFGHAGTIAAAVALPVAYQFFRMAYFATMVPNTALAKEAGRSDWRRGKAYLEDFAKPYRLTVPVALVAGWAGKWVAMSSPGERRRLAVVIGAPAVAALLHACYVVRLGGDFMHGRLLLPATFGLFMSVATLPTRTVTFAVPIAVTGWALACAVRLRPADDPVSRGRHIVDERLWWCREAGHSNPVVLDDYHRVASARSGARARRLADEGADAVVRIDGREHDLVPGSGVFLESITIGLGSTAAGPDVHVIDVLGLGDAVGSRIPPDPAARIGHQKRLPPALVLARLRLADEADLLPEERAGLRAARALLRTPAVAHLVAAISEPITLARARRNVRQAFSLTRLRLVIGSLSDPAPSTTTV